MGGEIIHEFDFKSLSLLRTAIFRKVPDDGVLDESLLVVDDHVAGIVVVFHQGRRLGRLQFRQLLLLDQNLTLI